MKNAIGTAALLLTACASNAGAPIIGSEKMPHIDSAPELFSSVADLSDGPYVFGDDGAISEEKQAVFLEAIERINADVGFEAVRYEPGNYMAQGIYVNEVPEAPTRIAHAFRKGDQGDCFILMGRDVFMGTVGSPRRTIDINVAMHESLHCLGINHDENPDSLMFHERHRDSEQPMTEATVRIIQAMGKRKVKS